MCGVDHKTVKRVIENSTGRGPVAVRLGPPANYEIVRELVAVKVAKTQARITAKRLLGEVVAAGYAGSERNLRRLVAQEKQAWRRARSAERQRRPAVWSAGEYLVIDWGVLDGLKVFCAVLAFSRVRFVRFADNERAETTLGMLAECFETLGGVPKVVLADRMGCLKAGVVADVVIPTPDYVRFATHYRFRPDFCQGYDPASKGIVENLVGYAKTDLMVPLGAQDNGLGLAEANTAAAVWCTEVNNSRHSEIAAVPAQRFAESESGLLAALPSLRPSIGRRETRKVDKLSTVRFASARYSVPKELVGTHVTLEAGAGRLMVIVADTGEIVAEHPLLPAGQASILDAHYGGPRPNAPARRIRPRTPAEQAFCALGPVAQEWLKGAAAAGNTRLKVELAELAGLEAAHGRVALIAALRRAVAFGRWWAADVRSILAAGTGVAHPAPPGEALVITLPVTASRSLRRLWPDHVHSRRHRRSRRGCVMTAVTAAALPADLESGLRRLKLASMRAVAPELLVTAKTQRWTPEELLRALVETEINARDASNIRLRGKQACFPMVKTLAEFDLAASSIPAGTWAYLTSLEWITAQENLTMVGPAGTGKSHTLIAFGTRRGPSRTEGPLLHRRRAGRDPLPRTGRQQRRESHRGPAAPRPGHLRRGRLRAAGRHRHPAAVPVRRRRLRTAQPRHRQPLALRAVGPVPARAHHRCQPA